jgi:hypothetical protein
MTDKKKSGDAKNPQFEDFLSAKSSKPVTSSWATAAQIVSQLPFLIGAVDETFLRNRAREINPRTSSPWIPKPRNNHFDINPTILGLLEWFAAKAAAAGELPGSYDSAQAMANVFGTEKKTIIWLTRNGADGAQIGGSRIAPLPVLRRSLEITGQVADGNVAGIEGLEQWNKDLEIAQKVREDKIKGARENALAERRIFDLLAVESRVRTELLTPLRDGLHGLQKKFLRRKKNREAIATEIMTTDLPNLLEKLAIAGQPVKSE